MMFAGPPEATLEWNDAGVEGAYRFLKRLWAYAQSRSRRAGHGAADDRLAGAAPALRGGAARDPPAAEAGRLRLPAHAVQHRGVGRHEDAQRAGGRAVRRHRRRARRARARGPFASCCACCTRSRRTSRTCCGRSWATPRCLGDLLDAPWPQVDAARWRRTRSSWCCRSTASCAASSSVPSTADTRGDRSAPRPRVPKSQKHGNGAPPKKVDRRAGPPGQRRRLAAARVGSACRSFARARLAALRIPPARRGALRVRDDVPDRAAGAADHDRAAPLARHGVGSAKLVEHGAENAQVILDIVSVEDNKQILSLSGGGKVQRIPADQARAVPRPRQRRQRLAADRRSARAPQLHLQRYRSAGARKRRSSGSGARCRPTPSSRSCAACRPAKKPACVATAAASTSADAGPSRPARRTPGSEL